MGPYVNATHFCAYKPTDWKMNSEKVLVSSGKATALIQDEFQNYLLDKNFMVIHF
jgi:hypothetical protein